MKYQTLIFYFLLAVLSACSLGKNVSESAIIYDFPDQHSQFPGGADRLSSYISRQVNYPEDAQQQGIEGKVYVSFVVEKDGSISNIGIVRGVSESINNEAMRVIGSMPNWDPALKDGLIVRSRARVPISFVLH